MAKNRVPESAFERVKEAINSNVEENCYLVQAYIDAIARNNDNKPLEELKVFISNNISSVKGTDALAGVKKGTLQSLESYIDTKIVKDANTQGNDRAKQLEKLEKSINQVKGRLADVQTILNQVSNGLNLHQSKSGAKSVSPVNPSKGSTTLNSQNGTRQQRSNSDTSGKQAAKVETKPRSYSAGGQPNQQQPKPVASRTPSPKLEVRLTKAQELRKAKIDNDLKKQNSNTPTGKSIPRSK